MLIAEIPAEARAAIRARRRKEIDELDYRRELHRLGERGYTQREIAEWLGIAQPSVLSALKTAAKVAMPLEGFSGATPYEICQRYAAGFIGRPQLVDELTRFPYVKGGQTDGYDSLIVDPAGTWSEVDDAARRGLIEDDVYEEVFNRRHGLEQEQPATAAAEPKMIEAPNTDIARTLAEAALSSSFVAEAVSTARHEGGGFDITGPRGAMSEQWIARRDGGRNIERSSDRGDRESNVHGRDGRTVDKSGTPRTDRDRARRK